MLSETSAQASGKGGMARAGSTQRSAAPPIAIEQRIEAARREGFAQGHARAMARLRDDPAWQACLAGLDQVSLALRELGGQLGCRSLVAASVGVPAREKPGGDDVDCARVEARAKRAQAPSIGNDALAGSVRLPRAERLVLTVLAQYPVGRTKAQVAILAGYAVGGGGFNNAISALRTRGWLTGNASRMTITAPGLAALGPFTPLPRGRALLDYWLGRLPKAERKALEALVDAYPCSLSKAQLASRAGYEPAGGGFNNALSKLRTLELIRGRAEMRASDELFDAAARAR